MKWERAQDRDGPNDGPASETDVHARERMSAGGGFIAFEKRGLEGPLCLWPGDARRGYARGGSKSFSTDARLGTCTVATRQIKGGWMSPYSCARM